MQPLVSLAVLLLVTLKLLVLIPLVPITAQLQRLQTPESPAQRQLLLLVQDIQNQLVQQQNFLQQQQSQLQVPQLQSTLLRRVIAVDPPRQQLQPQLDLQPQPQLQAQRVQPTRTEQRQRPQANSTAQPQFLDPGVGRWLLNGDPACLPCICEAASGCDETLGCDDRGFCGPFLLSRRYWKLAGRPLLRGDSLDRPGASSDCLRDSFCAADAVRGYLDKFAQDCDGDRRVDCFDLARVHFQGPFNCRAPLQLPNDFSETFLRCWDASRRTR